MLLCRTHTASTQARRFISCIRYFVKYRASTIETEEFIGDISRVIVRKCGVGGRFVNIDMITMDTMSFNSLCVSFNGKFCVACNRDHFLVFSLGLFERQHRRCTYKANVGACRWHTEHGQPSSRAAHPPDVGILVLDWPTSVHVGIGEGIFAYQSLA